MLRSELSNCWGYFYSSSASFLLAAATTTATRCGPRGKGWRDGEWQRPRAGEAVFGVVSVERGTAAHLINLETKIVYAS